MLNHQRNQPVALFFYSHSGGNVTIPVSHEIPSLNALVDVEYLYAYRGGSIYQPVYRGQRTDLELSACTLSQLKFKPEGRVGHGI